MTQEDNLAANPAPYVEGATKGLSEDVVRRISASKNEPEWMLDHRLKSLEIFNSFNMPDWGPDLSDLDLDSIIFYADAGAGLNKTWDDVPEDIRRVYDRLGIPQAERRMLAGVGAQCEGEIVYHNLKEEWASKGVIFLNLDDAIKEHPDLVREYFMKCVPSSDHIFAALHGAVWSGGTFLYIPKGVQVSDPLQAYFHMNAQNMGQFEHTLIVVEDGALAHYIEGCSAPRYGSQSLHAGLVEIFIKEGATLKYSSVENWSKDVYNLNTKRAIVQKDAYIEWIGGNMGSGVTMLYPCSVLAGDRAKCSHTSLAFAGEGQWQDVGAKIFHMAPNTSSTVVSKSVSKDSGSVVYRGAIHIDKNAHGSMSSVNCDSLLLDEGSRTETIPDIKVSTNDSVTSHEATVGKLSEEDMYYLASRGVEENQAKAMIVHGFVDPIINALPMEYAVELNRLIDMEMEDSVG